MVAIFTTRRISDMVKITRSCWHWILAIAKHVEKKRVAPFRRRLNSRTFLDGLENCLAKYRNTRFITSFFSISNTTGRAGTRGYVKFHEFYFLRDHYVEPYDVLAEQRVRLETGSRARGPSANQPGRVCGRAGGWVAGQTLTPVVVVVVDEM